LCEDRIGTGPPRARTEVFRGYELSPAPSATPAAGSSHLGPVDPSFPALSGRLKFTVRRHKFNKDSPSSGCRVWGWGFRDSGLLFLIFVSPGTCRCPTRGEKSAYFKCGVVRFVPVTGGCRRISAGTLVTWDFYERTGFIIRTFLASSGPPSGWRTTLKLTFWALWYRPVISGEVSRGEKILYSGTEPGSYITEYTLVYEDSRAGSSREWASLIGPCTFVVLAKNGSVHRHVISRRFDRILGRDLLRGPPARWSATFSSKVNLPHVINLRALCGANLVT